MVWEKIFANHISIKELISPVYKEFLELSKQADDFDLCIIYS